MFILIYKKRYSVDLISVMVSVVRLCTRGWSAIPSCKDFTQRGVFSIPGSIRLDHVFSGARLIHVEILVAERRYRR